MNTLPKQDAATPPEDSTIRLIPLTQGKFAIVDAADFELVNQWRWHARNSSGLWYAVRSKHDPKTQKNIKVHMHRILIGADPKTEVDHIDGDGLNNRRSNLRLATHQQNTFNQKLRVNNTSGFKGVTWNKGRKKWEAQIKINGKKTGLGRFTNITEAANAYAQAAKRIHGEFTRD